MITRLTTLLRSDGGGPRGPESAVSAADSDDRTATQRPDADPSAIEGDGSSVEAEQPPFEVDQVFEILKNERRRRVLDHLRESEEGQLTLGDLAEQIAAEECEKPVSQINSQERKRVYVGLYQCHLPKMDDIDAIEYDKSRGTIALGDAFAHFERYLPEDRAADEDWRSYLHGISVLGLVTIPLVAFLGAMTTGSIWQPILALTIASSFAIGAGLAVLATR
ncbi:DUF7344 domain-containing protein [Halococcoides cellulosivorans]|uniref:DUF7344 domain-containing protein n=1 Tax=Halococcoides cellulosivorans TaxID=1679096 RepID=A0A2R4X3J0_9EURY|nr:hypothetical protein [Halococcoides cellulosivorans]AWB28365.1 hypothetical protein HARCEL1_11930 [Halococcoides cellulosivorans]